MCIRDSNMQKYFFCTFKWIKWKINSFSRNSVPFYQYNAWRFEWNYWLNRIRYWCKKILYFAEKMYHSSLIKKSTSFHKSSKQTNHQWIWCIITALWYRFLEQNILNQIFWKPQYEPLGLQHTIPKIGHFYCVNIQQNIHQLYRHTAFRGTRSCRNN